MGMVAVLAHAYASRHGYDYLQVRCGVCGVCGVVRCGVVWCSVVWCCVVRWGAVCVVWCGVVRCGPMPVISAALPSDALATHALKHTRNLSLSFALTRLASHLRSPHMVQS